MALKDCGAKGALRCCSAWHVQRGSCQCRHVLCTMAAAIGAGNSSVSDAIELM